MIQANIKERIFFFTYNRLAGKSHASESRVLKVDKKIGL